MKLGSMLRWGAACACAWGSLSAEVWRTIDGESFEGRLSTVCGPLAIVAGSRGSKLMSLDQIDDTGLGRVADFLAQRSSVPAMWSTTTSKVGKSLRGRLQVLRDNKLVAYDVGSRAEPELYLAYFGAHWCGPCQRFSPTLVQAYKRLKQAAPDRFELVFVSNDHDADEQLRYAREIGMPWPVIKYSSLGNVAPVERWAGNGIPCLVLLTREGELVFHTYRGEEYLGPEVVLTQFEQLLASMDGKSNDARRACHRLAVIQHLRAVGPGNSPPKPHLITLDFSRYHTLETKSLKASLEIDERGHVVSSSFEPALSAVLEYQIKQDASTWLFLPAVRDGQPKRTKVVLPLSL